MIQIRRFLLAAVFSIPIILLLVFPGKVVQAGYGAPSLAKFGFGAKINPQTTDIESVVRSASQVGFNRLAVEFDWTRNWPDPSLPIDLNQGRAKDVQANRLWKGRSCVRQVKPFSLANLQSQ